MMEILYLNTTGNTRTTLAEPLDMDHYQCTVVEMSGKTSTRNVPKEMYLCSDIVGDVFVHDMKLPMLRRIRINSQGKVMNVIHIPIWIPIRRQTLSKIRLYICNEEGNILSFSQKGLSYTLLLKPWHR